jgi:prepilin-type processing-associated H-X9-DG protein
MKQLQLGSILYAGDNNDLFPGNVVGGGLNAANSSWVAGSFGTSLNGGADAPSGCSTNAGYLGVSGTSFQDGGSTITLYGSIGEYAKAAGSYKCAADKSIDTKWKVSRVRSSSANMYVGMNAQQLSAAPAFGVDTRFKTFTKTVNFNSKLSSSDCFEFLDENPASLNDGYFEYFPNPFALGINDRPAVNHGSSTSFSFCDGHAELHKWHDAFLDLKSTYSATQQDPKWLAMHGTTKL